MTRFLKWLDSRTGIHKLLAATLDEPIPGGARLAYVFGSGLLFLFISQVITGVCLALYYVPSADHAHTTVAYIVKEVSSGSFVRSIHVYGSSAMIVVLLLHVSQTVLFGSYKGLREPLWLAGCGLFALVLGLTFTGYLLPWDQKAYFATAVGTNIVAEIPVVGPALQRFFRGGTEMGTLTVSRFYVAHVFVLPALVFAFVAVHVGLFRKAGAAGPPTPVEADAAQPFYPRQLLMDVGFVSVLMLALAMLARFLPSELGPEANPAETRFLPRPEWYYVPVFQWLKYWPGERAFIGIVLIPALLAGLFIGLPFLDRGVERRPWRRPVTLQMFALVLTGLVLLGVASYRDDRRDAAISKQLMVQHEAARAYMSEPFEPEPSAGSMKVANAALVDPVRGRGKAVFEAQSCDACHGADGLGTDVAPPLRNVGTKHPGAELAQILRTPTARMAENGMTPVDIPDDDFKALMEFLTSIK